MGRTVRRCCCCCWIRAAAELEAHLAGCAGILTNPDRLRRVIEAAAAPRIEEDSIVAAPTSRRRSSR